MKILLLFPQLDGQTGLAIKHSFEQLGHKVVAVDAKLDWQHSYDVSIDYKPDLVFCSRTKELTEEVIKIKQKFKDAVICMWNVDTKYTTREWAHLFPLINAVDYHFVVEYNLLDEWRKMNTRTYWLPQGLQDEVYDRPKEITEEDRRKYSCDVCFCGSVGGPHHGDRVLFLAAIRQAGFKLNTWGSGGNPRIYDEEHNKQVALAKISLCCSGWHRNEKCTSVRNYKILGAGGFALELYRKGIYEIFPADTIDCYATAENLVEKIRHWLDRKKERREIAERGYKWVRKNATYTHRIKMALEYMKEDLC
jgi:hypothetical protein